VGRLSIGRIFRGKVSKNLVVTIAHTEGTKENFKISKIFGYEAMNSIEVQEALAGDIVAIAGAENINMLETFCKEEPNRQDRFKISGREDLHLSVLVEMLRHEGFELQVSRPEVIYKF